MLEELVKRKKVELEIRLNTLENELQSWYTRSEVSGPLEKHHSQIRALQAHLKGWHTSIRHKLSEYEKREAEGYLSSCANAETLILSEHRIWDYFRSKFIQRQEVSFVDYLRAADEFAWACYQPVQQLVYPNPENAKRKEPPLVFLNGGLSPFSISRGKTFQPEPVAGEVLNLNPEDYLTKLPVPVVGVPWDQVSHLPAVLVIGHEVGHVVEDDFGLSTDLERILKVAITEAKAESRAEAWQSWLGEIFADLYGCLAGGPAFAGTLIDFLAKGKDRICGEERTAPKWDNYPTDYLRVRIILKALEVMGFKDETTEYERLWESYSSKMSEEYAKDIDTIVPKLLTSEQQMLGDKPIYRVLCFSKSQHGKVTKTLTALKKVKADTQVEIPTTDIRVLFAALRLAYESDSDRYVANKYGSVGLEHIKKNVIKKGVRRAGEAELPAKKLDGKLKAYEEAGTDWVKSIMKGLG